jgi:hypothetical protein
MSYTTIYKVTPNVSAADFQELRNAWGSAPLVWGGITEKVLHRDRHTWGLGDQRALWNQWENDALPDYVRAVLGMTFDRVYIERQHFRRAAADIRKFLEWAPAPGEHVNHRPTIAALMEEHADDEAFPALGFNHTSVSESLFQGPWDEEKEEYGPIDWTQFWSLYADLDAPPDPGAPA